MCVCGDRPVLYYSKVNISVLERLLKPVMGIIVGFILQAHHFLSNRSLFWRKIDSGFLGVLDETHVCVVVEQCCTISKSTLVY